MLIYANALRLSDDVATDAVLGRIAQWLTGSRREFPRVTAEDLLQPGRTRFRSNAYVEVIRADGEPSLYSLRYHHSDTDVVGREWFTEVGLARHEGGHTDLTVVVRTEEISSRVTAPIVASRPIFVAALAADGIFGAAMPGLDVKLLDDEYAAEALRISLDDPSRRCAYVIVSPDHAGEYVVTPEVIRNQVIGLAEVVQIPPGSATYPISEVLGKEFSAWGGAITIVLAPRGDVGSRTVKLLPNRLTEIIEAGRRPEHEVLEAVTHRANPILHAQHISPGKVRDACQRRELKTRKEEAARTGDLHDYAQALESENAVLELENEKVQKEKEAFEERLLTEQILREDEGRVLRYENESLKLQMEQLASSRSESNPSAIEDDIRIAILAAIAGDATPEEALLLIGRLFPERIEVLPSAYKSAKESRDFQHGQKAMDLLRKLATDYYDSLARGGKGDTQARSVFGNAYSIESESVARNKRAREMRTFDHRGIPVEMMQHLKIGVKDSVAETLRIHFDWDPAEQKIIIGHCGPHLPVK